MTYYNTTHLEGIALEIEEANSLKQEDAIMKVFSKNPNREFTPFEILELSNLKSPITSIRRAITNLTNTGLLEKTKVFRTGEHGKKNYCWRIKRIEGQQRLEL